MKTIQGFVTISEFVKNQPGQLSAVGELSTWSRTYSKEKGEYSHNAVSGYDLVTFKCTDQTTGLPTVVEGPQVLEILNVVKHAVSYARTRVRPYNPSYFRAEMVAAFHGVLTDFSQGEMFDNGVIALPGYLSWKSTTNNANIVKIWLADAAFADQYSDYSITVVPPIEPIDLLMGSFDSVKAQVEQRGISTLADAAQTLKTIHPETYYRIYTFDLYNKSDPTKSVKTIWPVLIYGKAGDNVDSIQEAIADYILDRTAHTQPSWEVILPDVFKKTEFVVLPRWRNIAVPNATTVAGLYSCFVQPQEAIIYAANSIAFYSRAHIDDNIVLVPFPYKGLMLEVVSGQTNTLNRNKIADLFKDYVPFQTTSADFARMSPRTRNWVTFMQDLLTHAEVATPATILPSNIRRTIRAGKLYVSGVYEGINYLVDTAYNRC